MKGEKEIILAMKEAEYGNKLLRSYQYGCGKPSKLEHAVKTFRYILQTLEGVQKEIENGKER